MISMRHSYFKMLCVAVVLSVAWVITGCDSSSSSSVFSLANQENAVSGTVVLKDSSSGNLRMSACRVWVEGRYNEGVFTDENGNFRLVAPSGNHRLIASMNELGSSYIGRSVPFSVSGRPEGSQVSIYMSRGTQSYSFRLKDSSGNFLNNQNVRATLWDLPVQYDYNANCFRTPLLPTGLRPAASRNDDSGLGVSITGGGFREAFIPVDVDAGPVLFEHTLSRAGETAFAPEILSVRSSQNGNTIDTDFVTNGLQELRMRVNFSGQRSEIATWSWNDGGIGRFIGQNGDRSNTFCELVWEPLSSSSVGTLTFKLSGKNGLSSDLNISINESLMKSGSYIPESTGPNQTAPNISVVFSGLNEMSGGVVYNPEILYSTESDDLFKIKINISGIRNADMLKNGNIIEAVQIIGADLVSDDTIPENSLTERVYTLKRPKMAGVHKISAVITDNIGRKTEGSYSLRVVEPDNTDTLSIEKISILPSGEMQSKDVPVKFTACAYISNDALPVIFKWYINSELVFEETNNQKGNKKYSCFQWDEYSSLPLDSSLADGKYEIKCVASSGNINHEKVTNVVIGEKIQLSFVPQQKGEYFNLNWIKADSYSPKDFRVHVGNRTEDQIKNVVWEIAEKGKEYRSAKQDLGPRSIRFGVRSGLMETGCYIDYEMSSEETRTPGSYTVRLTVTDVNGRIDSVCSDEFYSDGDPALDQLIVEQEFREKIKNKDGNNWSPNLRNGIVLGPEMNDNLEYDIRMLIYTKAFDGDPNDPLEFNWEVAVLRYTDIGNSTYVKVYEENRVINNGDSTKPYGLYIPWGVIKKGEYCRVTCTVKDKLYGNFTHSQWVYFEAGLDYDYIYGSDENGTQLPDGY